MADTNRADAGKAKGTAPAKAAPSGRTARTKANAAACRAKDRLELLTGTIRLYEDAVERACVAMPDTSVEWQMPLEGRCPRLIALWADDDADHACAADVLACKMLAGTCKGKPYLPSPEEGDWYGAPCEAAVPKVLFALGDDKRGANEVLATCGLRVLPCPWDEQASSLALRCTPVSYTLDMTGWVQAGQSIDHALHVRRMEDAVVATGPEETLTRMAEAVEYAVCLAADMQVRADEALEAMREWAGCFGTKACPGRVASNRRCHECWLRCEETAKKMTMRDRMQAGCGAKGDDE